MAKRGELHTLSGLHHVAHGASGEKVVHVKQTAQYGIMKIP